MNSKSETLESLEPAVVTVLGAVARAKQSGVVKYLLVRRPAQKVVTALA